MPITIRPSVVKIKKPSTGEYREINALLDTDSAKTVYYGVSSTAADTQTKTVAIEGITELSDGLLVRVLFANAQSYSGTPKLQINSTTASNIKWTTGADASTITWEAGEVLDFVYVSSANGFVVLDRKAINDLNSAIGDISNLPSGSTDLVDAVGNLNTAINSNESAIAIVANGNTHAAIAKDRYVYIKGHGSLSEGLYKATAAIPLNGTLSTSNVTAVTGGGLNGLIEENFSVTSPYITWASDSFCNCKKIGNIIMINGGICPIADAPTSGWTNAALIPEGYRPTGNVLAIGFGYGGGGITNTYAVRVQSWGGIQVMQLHNNVETCYFNFSYFLN